MSDYQKLKAMYDELKEKYDKQELMISQLKYALLTMLEYSNFVRNKVVRLFDVTREGGSNE